MNEYVVQLPNGGLQCKTSLLLEEFNHCGSLHTAVLNFTRKFMAQVSQTALCNRLHPLEQRLARWLLMCDDRSHSNELELTQEFLGIMAGSTRASVTLVAITLKSAGFIAYTRGKITIVDRAGLEDFSCECYRLVKDIYDG
jgi:CRP-like cAMP-binding protein